MFHLYDSQVDENLLKNPFFRFAARLLAMIIYTPNPLPHVTAYSGVYYIIGITAQGFVAHN